MLDDGYRVFLYQYGDTDIVSKPGRLLLRGKCDSDLEGVLRAACESGEFFVAEQVGVPVLYAELYALSGGPTIDDVAFHEFLGLRLATKEEVESLSTWSGLNTFVSRFCAVKHWDCRLSPHCF
ncbi:MAG: hypothetical protein ABI114_14015 [Rhodanobacter sp.]